MCRKTGERRDSGSLELRTKKGLPRGLFLSARVKMLSFRSGVVGRGAGVYVRGMSEKPAPDGVVPPIKAYACGPFGSPGEDGGRLSGSFALACRCRILFFFLLGTTT